MVDNQGEILLGRDSALQFGVLHLPEHANVITSEEFAKTLEKRFPAVFKGIGLLKNYQADIHIDESVPPVAQKPRPVPFALREKVSAKIRELLDDDIIEPVQGPTPWVSPIVVAPKPNGDIRLCIDMRRVNEAVIRERYPFPTVDETLQQLNGSSVFTKIDLRAGFHQIQLTEEARNYTVFATPDGLFRYKRMMFGLSSAPEQYQHIIRQVLSDCEGCASIADDLVVHGKETQDHDERLDKVLQRLADRGLTVNPAKCSFRQSSIEFFGLQLTKQGVKPTAEKVQAVRDAPAPTNASETRSFLGTVGFSSRFIPDFATVAEPLRRICQKGSSFEWGPKQQEAFDALKDRLATATSLAYYDSRAPTEVVADASPFGLGAVLVQVQDGIRRAVSYASRTLTPVERRYSQTEREALALVWSCERFRQYLLGRQFTLVTDHQPLKAIYAPASRPSARVERWVLRLQEFRFTVRHIPGPQNIADALSRLPIGSASTLDNLEESIRAIIRLTAPVALSIRDIERASEADEELRLIRSCLLSDDWTTAPAAYAAARYELASVGFVVTRGTRIVIPTSLRGHVLALAHEGHQGIAKTKSRLRTKVWWPHIDRDTETTCKRCSSCQVVSQPAAAPPVQPTTLPKGPWQHIAVDLLGPLPSGDSLLVSVDYYSRYFEVDVIRSTTTEVIIEKMEAHFARHGLPLSLRSDNGPQFVAAAFTTFLAEHAIEHRRTTPYWPRANGEVERQNRSILKVLRIAQLEGKPWKTELNRFLLAYRTTPHSATGHPPASLIFNRTVRGKLPALEMVHEDTEVRDNDTRAKHAMAEYANHRRQAPVHQEINPGDAVLMKKATLGNKLDTPFHPDPHTVISTTGDQVVVESPDGVPYRRNIQFLKKVDRAETASTPPATPEAETEAEPAQVDDTPHNLPKPSTAPTRYSLRPRETITPPARYQ